MKFFSAIFTSLIFSLNLYSQPKTYSEAMNEISWTIWEISQTKKELKKHVEEQVSNLDTLNKIKQIHTKLVEMQQRENIQTAVKIADLGISALGIVTGGISIAAKEGGKEALKWYFAKEITKEVAKEAVGIPGYSDITGSGVFIFNKADENQIKSQVSKESAQIFKRVQDILNNPDTSYRDKAREIFQLTLEMEEKVDTKQNQIKGIANLLEEKNKKIEELKKIAQKLKEDEKKKEEETKKEIKQVEYKPNITAQPKTPQITAQTNPNDSSEEKRKKMQEAIDKYVNSLSINISKDDGKICNELRTIKAQIDAKGYDPKSYWENLDYLKAQLDTADTYAKAESVEIESKNMYESLVKQKKDYQRTKEEIKNKIEPVVKNIVENIELWKNIYSKYTSLGYYVSKPQNIDELFGYNTCYIKEMSNIETFLSSTNGLEGFFSTVESDARTRKNTIYKMVLDYAKKLESKIEDFKSKKPIYEKEISDIFQKTSNDVDKISSLRHQIKIEFSFNGSKSLKNLNSKVSEASTIYSNIAQKYLEIAQKYNEITKLPSEIYEMKSTPLYSEMSYISYQAQDQSHKNTMLPIYKKIQDTEISLNLGYYNFDETMDILSKNIISAKKALEYLETQKNKIVQIYSNSISEFKQSSQRDFSSFYTNPKKLSEEISKLDLIYDKANQKENEIISEIVSKKFFAELGEDEPTLKGIGFNEIDIEKKRAELQKTISEFWSSPKGMEIKMILPSSQNNALPSQAVDTIKNNYIKKLYDDLKSGYETKSISKIISLLDSSWASPEGEGIEELREHLTNIFKVFNEIKFNITNLQVNQNPDGTFTAHYSLEMISKIYSKNIKRVENSTVSEKIKIEDGKAKIIKTETGNYWLIK